MCPPGYCPNPAKSQPFAVHCFQVVLVHRFQFKAQLVAQNTGHQHNAGYFFGHPGHCMNLVRVVAGVPPGLYLYFTNGLDKFGGFAGQEGQRVTLVWFFPAPDSSPAVAVGPGKFL